MITSYFKRAFACRRMAASHLSIILEVFVSDLHGRGHSRNTIHFYVQAVEHFGRWLQQRRILVHAIREDHARRFLFQHLPRCACPIPAARSFRTCRAAIGRLMDTLHRHGFASSPKPRPLRLNATDRLLEQFDHHLDRVCGLSASTRRARQRYARRFLSWRFKRGRLCLRALKPKDLLLFVNRYACTWTRGGIHDLIGGLRSFLRFLEFSEQLPVTLSHAVPKLAPIPANQPPTVLTPEQLDKFLRSFDRKTPSGRRDFAVAICLSQLGLRASEVAGLDIGDLDWRTMTMRLRRTKQQRERLLPMPSKVAQAIAAYLKNGRPASNSRALFVRHRAPLGEGLKSHHVRSVARVAFAHCGIDYTGTHVLRHTWATTVHRRGIDLKLVADVLGHRSLNTTARYAHVNLNELRQAALPWPQGRKRS
jgi:integrase/recombinase XerD